MGNAVGVRTWEGAASRVGETTSAKGVELGAITTGAIGDADVMGAVAGAHAAIRTANRLRVVMRRVFISISFRGFISENPYGRINTSRVRHALTRR